MATEWVSRLRKEGAGAVLDPELREDNYYSAARPNVVRGFRGSCRSAWACRLSQALPCARYRLGAQNRPCLPPAVHRVPVTTVWCMNPLFEPGPATCPRPPRCGRGAPSPPETPKPRPNPAALPGAGLVRLRRAALP